MTIRLVSEIYRIMISGEEARTQKTKLVYVFNLRLIKPSLCRTEVSVTRLTRSYRSVGSESWALDGMLVSDSKTHK